MMPADEITDRAQELLTAIRGSGVWLSRAEIARLTGKNRISPHDVMLLERLISKGAIEKRERDTRAPVGVAYEYRAKESE